MRWLPLVLLTLAFAGCTDTPEPDALEGVDATGDSPDEPEYVDVVVAVPRETPVDWSGHTKEGIFVCSDPQGATGCPAGTQVAPDNQFQTTISYEGTLTHVSLNLDWEPADASQTGLVLAIYDSTGTTLLGIWEDDASFTVDEDLAHSGSSIVLNVWPSAKGGSGQYFFVDASQQSFTVTGTLRTLTEEITQVPVE